MMDGWMMDGHRWVKVSGDGVVGSLAIQPVHPVCTYILMYYYYYYLSIYCYCYYYYLYLFASDYYICTLSHAPRIPLSRTGLPTGARATRPCQATAAATTTITTSIYTHKHT